MRNEARKVEQVKSLTKGAIWRTIKVQSHFTSRQFVQTLHRSSEQANKRTYAAIYADNKQEVETLSELPIR